MPGRVFINYRRDDFIGTAGRLHDRLVQAFGRGRVFMDVDHIPAGVDFVDHLHKQVSGCKVFLVVVGPSWLDTKDETGKRRLDDPDDFVAVEIGAALARDIRVIPVLVDGAKMPKATDLPDHLKSLVRRNATEVRNSQFGRDADALVEKVRDAFESEDGPHRVRVSPRYMLGGAAAAAVFLIGIAFYRLGLPASLMMANPPPAPISSPLRLPLALPNGIYTGSGAFTGPRSCSDALNCPPQISFNVAVQDGRMIFDTYVPIGNYTRHWTGNIDQSSGMIALRGSDATPPTEYALTVTGRFDNAIIDSAYCGPGYFRISR